MTAAESPTRPPRRATDAVAVILAVGMATALNLFTVAAVLDGMLSIDPGLSENSTQILTGWGGGVIGVLGAIVGYRAGQSSNTPNTKPPA